MGTDKKSTLRLISTEELAARLGVSRVTIWRMCKEGILPPKRQLSRGRVAFIEEEVEAFIKGLPEA